jgi:hypothetical protein
MIMIDWHVTATIASPIIALFVGAWINRRFESRPILITYTSHVSAFMHTPAGGQQIQVNTHSVVIKNTGHRPATNVHVSHHQLPDFNIWPHVVYTVVDLPGGGKDIVIPTLVPNEVITISYLYFLPLTFDQVHAGLKCDQGFARGIPVLLEQVYPKWFNITAGVLLLIGTVTVLYLAYHAVVALVR